MKKIKRPFNLNKWISNNSKFKIASFLISFINPFKRPYSALEPVIIHIFFICITSCLIFKQNFSKTYLKYFIGEKSIDLIVHGHTHRYRSEKILGSLVFNPGESAGMFEGKNAIGLVNLKDLKAKRIFF